MTGDSSTTPLDSAAAREGIPRRSVRSRLSVGHLAMILAAILAGVLNYSVLTQGDDRQTVLVAAHPLEVGAVITESSIATAELSAEDALIRRFLSPEQLAAQVGHVVVTPLAAGDPLRPSDIVPPLQAGFRAMSVPIERSHAAGGAIASGDRVDVIDVRDDGASYVVAGVLVLSVPSSGSSGALSPTSGFYVTLSVSAAEALCLADALRNGQIDIVRSTPDSGAQATCGQFRAARSDPAPPQPGEVNAP